jgi:hypothetical protein
MAKYRKKPIVVEAEQYIPGIITPFLKEANIIPIDSDTDWECKECGEKAHYHMNCPTLEGWHIVCPGDYIIKGIKGEFYPCKPDIFEMTYEKVDSENLSLRSKECIQYISETIKVDEKIVSKVLQAEDEYIEYILKVISKNTESEENNYGK